MKKILSFILLATLCTSLTACGASSKAMDPASWKDGSYTNEAKGYGDPFDVRIRITNGRITTVEIGENNETDGKGSLAIDQLPDVIIEKQTTQVDAISGATVTSNAILEAIDECLKDACK